MIPRGKLTVIAGDPGLGKSFLTLSLAAMASRGVPFPGSDESHASGPLASILLSAEDDPADTIRPRLEKMGADLTKVIVMDGIVDAQDRCREFVIGENVAELREVVNNTPDLGLIVVDPVSAYVGESDSYNNAHVRAMLKPLSDLAADTGVAVVLVTHLRKSEAAKVLHKAMGSLAFTAAARCVLVVVRDRDDNDLRLVLTAKSNLSNDRMGFSYRVSDGSVVWGEPVEGTADEVMAGKRENGHDTRKDKQQELARQIHAVIAEDGSCPTARVEELSRQIGVARSIVQSKKFKDANGFKVVKKEAVWWWVALQV
jgi:RecA/RadA recombinase